MAVASSAGKIDQLYRGFAHLRKDLLADKVMLKSSLEPVSFLDGFRSAEPTDSYPDFGRPHATPPWRALRKGHHHGGAGVEELAQVSKKTNSAVSSRYVHVAGEADEHCIVVSFAFGH